MNEATIGGSSVCRHFLMIPIKDCVRECCGEGWFVISWDAIVLPPVSNKLASSEVSGLQKASILMLALGEDHASKIFAVMHEDEIKSVSATMAQLGPIKSNSIEILCSDFINSFGSVGGILGSFDSTENLLLKALPKDRVDHIMEEIRGPAGRTMWDKLGNVSEEILANYLKNEYPQTVSVVLSMIRADHSAKVLALLPDSFAMEVVMRMLRMEAVQKDVLERVEKILRSEFMSNLARTSKQDPHQLIADIFNNFDRSSEAKFLKGLDERNRESAERVKAQMFTFSDIQRLSSQSIGVLLRGIDKDKLPIALKGAPESVKALFFSQLSERSVKMLKDDISSLGPVKVKDVEDAQATIAGIAKDLAARGEIDINVSTDDRIIE